MVTVLREVDIGNVKAIWLIWAGLGWNYFAYGSDKRMLPWQFVELVGNGKGNPMARGFVFWLTAAIHLTFIAAAGFADIGRSSTLAG
jgi:hypothetical protein